ncbi:MAG: polymerase [Gracilibacter sp. BRH_c7a]|nr:MAG: polymerase [Gracilibacter sp. BRH_c7a]
MEQWIIFGLTIVVLLLLMVLKPSWLVPLLVFAVALEISITWYPDFGRIGEMLGMVSLAKLTSFALILAAFSRVLFLEEMRRKLSAVFRDPLTIMLTLFLVLGAASVVYSADPGKTVGETVRLLVLFAVFISCALLLDKEKTIMGFRVLHLTALAIAPLTFYEGFTGNLIWQGENLLREETLRVNATFIDPNIFARYIILGIVSNLVLQLQVRDKGIKLAYMASLAILLAQLAFTASRGGLLTVVAILIVALIILPNRKAVLWVLGLGALLGLLVVFLQPEMLTRILSIFQNPEVSNPQRLYLWKVAIAIFQDHTITGTGLGTFQTVFLSDYAQMQTVEGATLSHTTVLTIAAELGVIGLTVLGLIWIALLGKLISLYSSSHSYQNLFHDDGNEYYIGAGSFLWALTVFISSQGEGRFFEDPIFWLSCAILVTLKFAREYNVKLS